MKKARVKLVWAYTLDKLEDLINLTVKRLEPCNVVGVSMAIGSDYYTSVITYEKEEPKDATDTTN